MPITSHIDSASGLVTLTVHGPVDGAMIKQALQTVVEDPLFRRGADVLWDFADARGLNPSGEGIQDLVRFVGSLREKRGSGYRVAIVTRGDLEYGFARMYEAYAENLPFALRVFRDRDEATLWLKSQSRTPEPGA